MHHVTEHKAALGARDAHGGAYLAYARDGFVVCAVEKPAALPLASPAEAEAVAGTVTVCAVTAARSGASPHDATLVYEGG